jgi:hypothetical protein
MTRHISIGLVAILISGCAAQSPSVGTLQKISPEVEGRVRRQISDLQTYCEVVSVERVALDDGKQGWLITYRQVDETFAGPRTFVKWIKLGSEGYLMRMSPIDL